MASDEELVFARPESGEAVAIDTRGQGSPLCGAALPTPQGRRGAKGAGLRPATRKSHVWARSYFPSSASIFLTPSLASSA